MQHSTLCLESRKSETFAGTKERLLIQNKYEISHVKIIDPSTSNPSEGFLMWRNIRSTAGQTHKQEIRRQNLKGYTSSVKKRWMSAYIKARLSLVCIR